MIYSPSRGIWTPPLPHPLPYLTPEEWERGTRPWHKECIAPDWRPGDRYWLPPPEVRERGIRYGCQPVAIRNQRQPLKPMAVAVGPSATPMHFYRLEEASGNRVDSGTVGGFDLTPTGTPGNATGLIGNGVSLSTTKYLNWAGTQFALGSGVSITAWIWAKFSSFQTSECAWFSQNNAAFTQGWWLGDNGTGGKPQAYACTISNGLKSFSDTSAVLSTTAWFFLVFRYDSSAKTAYIRSNDTTQGSISTVSDLAVGGLLSVGDGQEGIHPNAVMDAAAYFNSSLSSADITAGWAGGAGTEFYGGVWH